MDVVVREFTAINKNLTPTNHPCCVVGEAQYLSLQKVSHKYMDVKLVWNLEYPNYHDDIDILIKSQGRVRVNVRAKMFYTIPVVWIHTIYLSVRK